MDSEETIKEKQYEIIYRTYSNDIYKICLYYLRDEDEAMNITQQVFWNFYSRFQTVDEEQYFTCLVRNTMNLINSRKNSGFRAEEVEA